MAQYAQPMASYPLPTSTGIAAPPGLPARPPVANPGEALPPVPGGGTTRMAEDDLEGEPNAKRARVAKLDGGYHPEEEWIASHPVSLFSDHITDLVTEIFPSFAGTYFDFCPTTSIYRKTRLGL